MASNIHTGRKIFLSASMKFHGLPGGLSPVALSIRLQTKYLQPIITQYFIDNKSEIWLLFLIAHSKR